MQVGRRILELHRAGCRGSRWFAASLPAGRGGAEHCGAGCPRGLRTWLCVLLGGEGKPQRGAKGPHSSKARRQPRQDGVHPACCLSGGHSLSPGSTSRIPAMLEGSAPSCPPPDPRAPPGGTAQSAHGDQGLPEVSAVWGRVGRNAGAGGFPSHSRAPTSSPFISCGPRWARHHQPRGLPRRPAAGHGLAAKRDRKHAGDHTAGVAPWVRAEALSQSQRLSGPARKIPASCGPVSPTSPAAAGFSPAGTCRAAAGAVGQQHGECPSVGPWGLPRSGGAPGVLGCARRR